jgi:hypothetical protein
MTRHRGHHPILLGAPRAIRSPVAAGRGSPPAILQRSDDDFITATVEQLRDAAGMAALQAMQAGARTPARLLKLYPPVQRLFHLALLEAWCDTPGAPRLDPARVASAGFVIRRLRRDENGSWTEGWMTLRGKLLGWARTDRLALPPGSPLGAGSGAAAPDPVPANRLPLPGRGAALDAALKAHALALPDALLEERTHPLYLAPPDVCNDAGRTLWYGLVPTASTEIAATPAPESETFGDAFGPDSAAFVNHLVEPLRGQAMNFPLAGQLLKTAFADAEGRPSPARERPSGLTDLEWSTLNAEPGATMFARLSNLLRQLSNEFDAFGSGAAPAAVQARLAAIPLPLPLRPGELVPRQVNALAFLRNAKRILLDRDGSAPATEMPQRWPVLAAAEASALRAALSQALRKRLAAVRGNGAGRFDEPGARYILVPFVRLKGEGGCPPRTLWGEATEPFVIAPWYEGGGAPPVQIAMPDPKAPGFLNSLQPNVSFVVPPSMQGLLGGTPKDLLDGKGDTGNLTLGWICSFNLPIITICAFIVLNIFLSLFNLFFGWLAFIKICIPYPKRSDG